MTGQNIPTPVAAEIIGISARTLEKWRVTGQGPTYLKLGKRVLYPVRDLESWIQGQKRRSTSDEG